MALIIRGKTRCPLCYQIIATDDDVVAASQFIADPADSLWRYSDAGFHRRCFAEWDRRAEFVSRFNEAARAFRFGNGKRHHMQDDGSIIQIE
jgi:hypothetical protein